MRYGALSPAKIIHKGSTRYENACILIESVRRLPRENMNSAGSHEIVPFVSLQINVSPRFAAQKTSASHVEVFLIYANFSRLFLSAILYDLSAILQAERLAFRPYDALKIRSIGSFSFLTFYNIQNTADLRLYAKYEL